MFDARRFWDNDQTYHFYGSPACLASIASLAIHNRLEIHLSPLVFLHILLRKSLLHLPRQPLKNSLNVDVLLRRGLKVHHPLFLCISLRILIANLSGGVQVALVSQQNPYVLWMDMPVCFVQPCSDVLESLFVGQVEHHYHALGVPVSCTRQSLEALLTSRIPNLHFGHSLAIPNSPDLQIDPNSREQRLMKDLLSKPLKQTSLAYCTIANEEDLEDEVAGLRLHGE